MTEKLHQLRSIAARLQLVEDLSKPIYRRTRNPLYLGTTLIYVGLSVAAGSLWAIVLTRELTKRIRPLGHAAHPKRVHD